MTMVVYDLENILLCGEGTSVRFHCSMEEMSVSVNEITRTREMTVI